MAAHARDVYLLVFGSGLRMSVRFMSRFTRKRLFSTKCVTKKIQLGASSCVTGPEKNKIKGRSVLTLYGSPEANRSISLGHPRLGFVAGNRRTGRGREKQGEGERSIWDNGGSDTCCFSNLKSPPACGTRGIITPSRDRHPAAGSRPDSWTVPPHGDFSFLPPAAMPKVVSRAAVSTSQDGPYPLPGEDSSVSDYGLSQPYPHTRLPQTSVFTVRPKLAFANASFDDSEGKDCICGEYIVCFLASATYCAQVLLLDRLIVDHRQATPDPSKATDR